MIVVGVNLIFDCDRLGRWSKLGGSKVYQVSSGRGGLISARKREI